MNKAIDLYLKKHGFGQFRPRAVLFDMDGVIYNSMPNHAKSWHESMATFGLDMPPEGAYLYEGMRGVETIKLLARKQWNRELSDEEAARMYEVKSATFAKCPPPEKMDGIMSLMQQIKDSGMRICVVTGSGQHTLLDKLTVAFEGLIERDYIVTAYDVKHGKPAPDPYLAGMQKTGTAPWETIVVENAPLGVRAAVAAKCFTIAANTGPLADETLLEAGADMVLPSIAALSDYWPMLSASTLMS
ncbi:MAG: HAD-IA family hydrolase [Prevotella sp.]|nr:HAD-IA family hydrolase [Prevotella sp.]MBR1504648.1 HAD-IA family hydrolase [Prevotella sp.]